MRTWKLSSSPKLRGAKGIGQRTAIWEAEGKWVPPGRKGARSQLQKEAEGIDPQWAWMKGAPRISALGIVLTQFSWFSRRHHLTNIESSLFWGFFLASSFFVLLIDTEKVNHYYQRIKAKAGGNWDALQSWGFIISWERQSLLPQAKLPHLMAFDDGTRISYSCRRSPLSASLSLFNCLHGAYHRLAHASLITFFISWWRQDLVFVHSFISAEPRWACSSIDTVWMNE